MSKTKSAIAFTVFFTLGMIGYFILPAKHSSRKPSVHADAAKTAYDKPKLPRDRAQEKTENINQGVTREEDTGFQPLLPNITHSPPIRLMKPSELASLADSGYSCFDNLGNINQNIYEKFAFTLDEQKSFSFLWQKIFDQITATEFYNLSNIIEQNHTSSFTIGPFPQTGQDLLEYIHRKLDGKVSESFLEYFTNYSQNDSDFLLYNRGQSRKQVMVEKRNSSDYQITESVELMNHTTKQWETVNSRSFSFSSLPERYKRIFKD